LLPFGSESPVFPSAVEKLKIRIYKTIILPVILYGGEIWYLTLREKHVSENRVQMKIFD
jgi:hypothetical protein